MWAILKLVFYDLGLALKKLLELSIVYFILTQEGIYMYICKKTDILIY